MLCKPADLPALEGGGWFGAGSGFGVQWEALSARYGSQLSGRRADLIPHAREVVRLASSVFAAGQGDTVKLSDDVLPGVAAIATGAWFDPVIWDPNNPLECHGNPNAVTLDIGASHLTQACVAQTCLVEIETFRDLPSPVRALADGSLSPSPCRRWAPP